MRWQGEQNVFAEEWGEIHELRSREILVKSKGVDFDHERKRFEARDTVKLDGLSKGAVGPERALGDTNLQIVVERARTFDIVTCEIPNRAFLFPRVMPAFGGNLVQVNFHDFRGFDSRVAADAFDKVTLCAEATSTTFPAGNAILAIQ